MASLSGCDRARVSESTALRVSTTPARRELSTPPHARRTFAPVWWAVLGIMALSLGLEVWAVPHDLPYPNVDEPTFVRPAVHMAATGDPNPHWFGHPGSTTIYPLAGIFHVWDAVGHGGPVFSPNGRVAERFVASPGTFYLIGRLWSIAFAVAAIPLVFLLGRRCFSTAVGLAGAGLWALLPLAVSHGRVVRTDSAGVFFALLALLLIMRLFERASVLDYVLAGLAIGVGISSRYFLVTLLAPFVVAGVIAIRRHVPGASARGVAAGVGAAAVAFVVTTPYFFLDWSTARASLANENTSMLGHSGLSPIGNLRWYLVYSIPKSITWPVVLLALIGIVFALASRPDPRRLVLLAGVATFLVSISMSQLHREYWPLPILPVVVLFAADGGAWLTKELSARLDQPELSPALAVAGVMVVALWPAWDVVRLDMRESRPSTGVVARRWIEANIPPGSALVKEHKTAPLDGTDVHWIEPNTRTHDGWTLDQYVDNGFRYFVINPTISGTFSGQPRRYPTQARFYSELRQDGCLLHVFRPSAYRDGPVIRVYKVSHLNSPSAAARSPDCTAPST
jgi:Dolichyl-phosphate-mannose-protein mannosyltransferase